MFHGAADPENVEATYIGDGVYAAIDPVGDLVLTSENGIEVLDRIVIEPEFYRMLETFVDMVRRKEIGRWRLP